MIRGTDPSDERSGLRYLRRRGNLQVRQARLTRSVVRWCAMGAAHLAIAGVLLFAAVRVFVLVTSADEFALVRVEVEGARRASADAIRERLEPYFGRNILDLDLAEVAAVSARDPWARWVSARRVFPGTLRLYITERRPAATAVIRGVAHVVDTTGHVIRPSGFDTADDLPVLTGLDGLSDEELIAALGRGVKLVARLEGAATSWIDEISELDLGRRDRILVRTIDPGPAVMLDPGRVERNLREYLELRNDIRRRVGPIRYVDLRWEDHITVMPVDGDPVNEES